MSIASGLSKKKVEQFLQTKTSYTKFGPAIRRFRGLQVFSKYINKTILEFNNENEVCQRHFTSFHKLFSLKNTPEKVWVDKGTEYGGVFKKIARRKTLKFTQQRVKQKLHLQREQFIL